MAIPVAPMEAAPHPGTRKMRDQRDPQLLGETYLKLRAKGVDIDTAVQMPVAPYENGKWMSSNPEHHHMAEFFTNLPEDAGDLSDGA